MYVGLTAACLLALWAAGMSFFDAICHAFSTLSLGGFSTHDANIGYFHSPMIEFVLMIFMLIAAMNFATHFVALRKGNFALYAPRPGSAVDAGGDHCELRRASRSSSSLNGVYDSFGAIVALRRLQCGIARDHGWIRHHRLRQLAGVRADVDAVSELRVRQHRFDRRRHQDVSLADSDQAVVARDVHAGASAGGGAAEDHPDRSCRTAWSIPYWRSSSCTSCTIAALTFALLISGLDFMSALSAIVACINSVGPGLNVVGPGSTYAALTEFQTWICTAAMFLGRIEIITFAVLFTPTFWRK